MAEELEKLLSKLLFMEEEEEGIKLGSSCTKAAKAVGKNCTVMKILTTRSINLDMLRKNLRMLWQPNRGLQISKIEEELFLVEFGDGKDKQKVLDICSWSFEKQLIIMCEFEGEFIPKDIGRKPVIWGLVKGRPVEKKWRRYSSNKLGERSCKLSEIHRVGNGEEWEALKGGWSKGGERRRARAFIVNHGTQHLREGASKV
nr:hypothetical protein CFP56_62431 [Quercus suber]